MYVCTYNNVGGGGKLAHLLTLQCALN